MQNGIPNATLQNQTIFGCLFLWHDLINLIFYQILSSELL